LRSPGDSSTRWNGATRPARTIAAQYWVSEANRSYSGPSCAITTRVVGVVGDQMWTWTDAFSSGATTEKSWVDSSGPSQVSHGGAA
jgi:hypothetical protein